MQVIESEKSQEQVIKCNIVGDINELEICCVSPERWTIYPLLKVSVLFFCKEIFFPLLKHKLKDTGQFIVIVLVTLRRVDISMCLDSN